MKDIILKEIEENISVTQDLIHTSIESIEKAADLMISVIKSGNKILWCGNGGSAADAQHLATELMGGMGNYDRRPMPSIPIHLFEQHGQMIQILNQCFQGRYKELGKKMTYLLVFQPAVILQILLLP